VGHSENGKNDVTVYCRETCLKMNKRSTLGHGAKHQAAQIRLERMSHLASEGVTIDSLRIQDIGKLGSKLSRVKDGILVLLRTSIQIPLLMVSFMPNYVLNKHVEYE